MCDAGRHYYGEQLESPPKLEVRERVRELVHRVQPTRSPDKTTEVIEQR